MKIQSEQDMLTYGASFAKSLLSDHHLNAVIELVGDVGAGKTTFVRGLASGLGISTSITSPSFTISRSYAFIAPDGSSHILDHYDFYRLSDPGLMIDTLSESIRSGHLVIVEWADTVKNILPTSRISIHIQLNDDGTREITISEPPSHSHQNPPTLASANSVSKHLPASSATPNHQNHIHLYLDTSTLITILRLNDQAYSWPSKNDLAEKLLQYLHDRLKEHHADWHDIASITFMSGPGSFTGLRIGAAIVNTLARELNIPLYDHHGKRHPIILPDYGRPANITAPKK